MSGSWLTGSAGPVIATKAARKPSGKEKRKPDKDGERLPVSHKRTKNPLVTRPADEGAKGGGALPPAHCKAFIRGSSCNGFTCGASHDAASFLAAKPPDIVEISPCPLFTRAGHCPYGYSCRLVSSHMDKDSLALLTCPPPIPAPAPVRNILTRSLEEVLKQGRGAKMAALGKPSGPLVSESAPTPRERSARMSVLDFRGKVCVAPLTTIGNIPFRRITKAFGADVTCAEMTLAGNLLAGQASEWALLRRHPCEDIFGIQIAGNKPEEMGQLASLVASGAISADYIDVNMGCPIDELNRRGLGAGLMARPPRLRKCLDAMASVLTIPLTVKMRMGIEDDKPIATKLVYDIRSWGTAAAVTVHGRSRQQRYTRKANWDYIAECARIAHDPDPDHPPLQFLGNGDVFSHVEWNEHLSTHGVDTCLLARGIIIKPWLPTEIKRQDYWDITATERLDMLKDFVRFGLENWGSDAIGVDRTRRFLLEWLSFLHRYVPVGLLEVLPQRLCDKPQERCYRSQLEALMASPVVSDWIRISELILGKAPEGFSFTPKHRAQSYE